MRPESYQPDACRALVIFLALRLAELVAIRPLETGLLTIDFAAVSDPENSYKLPRIINLVDDSVIADPNSPVVLGAE